MATPLPNHLLAHRKRSGLSQDELAYLLGTHGGSKVSRYERFIREPGLEAVLAYEAVLGKPGSQLFPGLYRKVEKRVIERARLLLDRSKRQKSGPMLKRKVEVLEAILGRHLNQP